MNRDDKKPLAVARDDLDPEGGAPIPMSSMLDVGYLSNRIGDVDKDVIDIVANYTLIIAQLSYRFGK